MSIHIFCGLRNQDFTVHLGTYYFLLTNKIIEGRSGNQHNRIFMLSDYYKLYITRILTEKRKKFKTIVG